MSNIIFDKWYYYYLFVRKMFLDELLYSFKEERSQAFSQNDAELPTCDGRARSFSRAHLLSLRQSFRLGQDR